MGLRKLDTTNQETRLGASGGHNMGDLPLKEIGTAAATVYKVTNTADGALRITIDISSGDTELASRLLKIAALNEKAVIVCFMEHTG